MSDTPEFPCPDCEAPLKTPLGYALHRCSGGESKLTALAKDMVADGSFAEMAREWTQSNEGDDHA